jgi:hypothetical protein
MCDMDCDKGSSDDNLLQLRRDVMCVSRELLLCKFCCGDNRRESVLSIRDFAQVALKYW